MLHEMIETESEQKECTYPRCFCSNPCENYRLREPGKYEVMGQTIGRLVDRKQKEYGDSWGKAADILRVLYPDGVKPEDYHYLLGIVRVIDKLARIANGNQGEENAWADIAGYGILGSYDKYK
jgi:hypothetical protein